MKRPSDKLAAAVTTLVEFFDDPVRTKRDVAGILQGFAMCFELAWRAAQAHIAELGYLERGPRPSLRAALQSGLIVPEQDDAWSQMMEDRNLVAHTYRPEWARDLVERIRLNYLPLFVALSEKLTPASEASADEDEKNHV